MAKTYLRPFGEMIRKFTKYVFFVRNEGVVALVETPSGEFLPLKVDSTGKIITS